MKKLGEKFCSNRLLQNNAGLYAYLKIGVVEHMLSHHITS
jgi:hypothetical protein